jgi:nucleoside phosphorylase
MLMPNTIPRREDFRIAILCAVGVEGEAVEKLFNKRWLNNQIGRNPRDGNSYSIGQIGGALVVVVWLPDIGLTHATAATSALSFSFINIEHMLVVGVCGGVPTTPGGQEIVLGDVVIGTKLVRYDQGEQRPEGFHTIGVTRPRKFMGAFLDRLAASCESKKLLYDYQELHLQRLLSSDQDYAVRSLYPGSHHDILFTPEHIHKHYSPSDCKVCKYTDIVCEESRLLPCSVLNCYTSDGTGYKHRNERKADQSLENISSLESSTIHFGSVGSGDRVVKSAKHRDMIAEKEKIIAFEMEAAGAYHVIDSIVVIKGVSDYADSHKNKQWQCYASAKAAACAGAFLQLQEQEYGNLSAGPAKAG